ncbi:MAG: hypothetical protein AB7O73_09060 [Bacteroidia bacterium]
MLTEITIAQLQSEIRQLNDRISELVLQSRVEALSGWVTEECVIKLTGLSKSSLYRLRKKGEVRSSFFVDKGYFYKLDDFGKLLDKNHRRK